MLGEPDPVTTAILFLPGLLLAIYFYRKDNLVAMSGVLVGFMISIYLLFFAK